MSISACTPMSWCVSDHYQWKSLLYLATVLPEKKYCSGIYSDNRLEADIPPSPPPTNGAPSANIIFDSYLTRFSDNFVVISIVIMK